MSLARDPILGPLCAKALIMLEKDRPTDTVRKQLTLYYCALLEEAMTERTRISIRLLRSRRGRGRIGVIMAALLEANDAEEPGTRRSLEEDTQ